jgi:hypothetical protein
MLDALVDVEETDFYSPNHQWSFQDTFLVYTMYRLNIFRGYKNSYFNFICEYTGIDYKSINMAYKNLDYLNGLKGLKNASKNLKLIHEEQGRTSLRSLVMMISDVEIRERLLNLFH